MKRFISIMLLAVLLATTVHVGITAYSAQKEQKTETPVTTEAAEPTEPEIVDEAPEFSEDETTTAAPEPTTEPQKQATVGKTVTKAAAPQEFADVSEVAVFSQQQEFFVEEPAEEAVTEETEEETEENNTGYEPVYDDPLPPEGEDWIE